MNGPLLLTDDEVLALAGRQTTSWPGGLPTVPDTEEAVRSAVLRGNRSLLVRGMHPDQAPTTALELVDSALGAASRAIVYLGDDDFRRSSWGLASAHHVVAAERWVFELVSPLGIHELDERDPTTHIGYLEQLVEAAFTDGPTSESGGAPRWLCIAVESPAQTRIAAVRRGEAIMADLERSEGDEPAVSSGSSVDQGRVVAELVEQMTATES